MQPIKRCLLLKKILKDIRSNKKKAVAFILLFLFLNWLLRGINIARSAHDDFGKLLGVGIVAWIGYQTLAHIGANIALVPLTGVPMPFFSYGGTALASLFAAIGIMANISKNGRGQGNSRRKSSG